MKKLLILGAGIYQVPLIGRAKEMGLYTIAASCPGNYPGLSIADEAWDVDTTDFGTLIGLAADAGISGVCTSGTDVAVISLGRICEALKLPGLSSACAEKVTDKAEMKRVFLAKGVSTPEAFTASSPEEALRFFEKLLPPVIVKAVDSSGSRGIKRADTPEELSAAYRSSLAVTKKPYVLIEKFIDAHEIGVDGFVSGGKIRFLLPHEKFVLKVGPTTIPEGHAFPYKCSAALENEIITQMEKAIIALGLDECAVNADVLVSEDHAYILEIGARAGATCIPELISAFCGFDYYEQLILHALGKTPDFSVKASTPCMAKLLFSPVKGLITGIDTDALRKLRSRCTDISLDYPAGSGVEPVQNGTSRIGRVIMKTSDEAELDRTMSLVRRCVRIDGTDLDTLWKKFE